MGYKQGRITWQELADFINSEMPECNRNEQVSVWDASTNNYTGGKFFSALSISPFNADEEPNEDNYYSIVVDTENGWN